MTTIIRFADAEIAEAADLEAIGQAARAGDEAIAGGVIGYPHHWADISVSRLSGVELACNPGTLWIDERVYELRESVKINLQQYLPLVFGDQRYVAILARGVAETLSEQRFVEIDAETEETVILPVPKRDVRRVEFVIQQGLAGPTPTRPTIAADQCCLAFVSLSSSGVGDIEMGQEWRAKTLYEVEGRVTELEGDVRDTTEATRTIRTDMSSLADRINEAPRPELIRQFARDIAAANRDGKLKESTRAYWFDYGLVRDDWDVTSANWLARIDEGVRFQAASERDSQLALYDPASASLRVYDNLLMPAWTEVTRIANEAFDEIEYIGSLARTQVDAVLREIARQRVTFGASFWVCENNAQWANFLNVDRQVGERFQRAGETFEIASVVNNQWMGHRQYTIRQVQIEDWTDTYWDYVTTNYGLNGSAFSQSWLQSQPGVLTSIEIYFARVGTDAPVDLVLVECNSASAPDVTRAIVRVRKEPGELQLGWNKFAIRPSLLDAGKRYAWVVVTLGNHALGQSTGNKFSLGTRFQSSDGGWQQGSLDRDFMFRANFAQFAGPRVEIEFAPLTLENGMSEIGLLYASWAPGGTAITWRIRPTDASDWTALDSGDAAVLMGLPPSVRLQAVFIGTPDLMPAIVLDANARGLTRRLRNDLRAVAKMRQLGYASSVVETQTTLDHFDPVTDVFSPRLTLGSGGVATPVVVTTTPDLLRPGRYSVRATFTLGAAEASVGYRCEMTTSKIVPQAFVQDVALLAQ